MRATTVTLGGEIVAADDNGVHAIGEQSAAALASQVVPSQVDALELLAVPDAASAFLGL